MSDKNLIVRNRYRRLSNLLLIQLVISVVLLPIFAYSIIWPPKPKFNVTTANGSIIPVNPLSAPIVSDERMKQWAGLRARDAFSLNFFSWKDQVHALTPYFTKGGFNALQEAYRSSNLLNALANDKLIMTSVVTKEPVILEKGVVKGHYTWRISLPLLVTYNSANQMTQVKFSVIMHVQRVPVMDQSAGIAINTLQVTTNSGAFGVGG